MKQYVICVLSVIMSLSAMDRVWLRAQLDMGLKHDIYLKLLEVSSVSVEPAQIESVETAKIKAAKIENALRTVLAMQIAYEQDSNDAFGERFQAIHASLLRCVPLVDLVRYQDAFGYSVLHRIAEFNHHMAAESVIGVLLSLRPNVNVMTREGVTPLDIVLNYPVRDHNHEILPISRGIVERLVQAGAHVEPAHLDQTGKWRYKNAIGICITRLRGELAIIKKELRDFLFAMSDHDRTGSSGLSLNLLGTSEESDQQYQLRWQRKKQSFSLEGHEKTVRNDFDYCCSLMHTLSAKTVMVAPDDNLSYRDDHTWELFKKELRQRTTLLPTES